VTVQVSNDDYKEFLRNLSAGTSRLLSSSHLVGLLQQITTDRPQMEEIDELLLYSVQPDSGRKILKLLRSSQDHLERLSRDLSSIASRAERIANNDLLYDLRMYFALAGHAYDFDKIGRAVPKQRAIIGEIRKLSRFHEARAQKLLEVSVKKKSLWSSTAKAAAQLSATVYGLTGAWNDELVAELLNHSAHILGSSECFTADGVKKNHQRRLGKPRR
jgi:hypothetical protein